MKKLILSVLAGALVATSVNAQEAAADAVAEAVSTPAPLVFGGSIDTYYRTSLNTSDKGGNAAPATSFADGTGFSLGLRV